MPDPATLLSLGLLGLFLAAFMAGSIVPFASEVVLVALVQAGANPALAVCVATAGNVLGAVTLYLIGAAIARGGARWLGPRLRRLGAGGPAAEERARARIERWGAVGLLLSWVPIAGDAFVLGAGLVGIRWRWFLGCVTLGKAGRYLAVVAFASGW